MFKKILPLLIIAFTAGIFYGCASSNPYVSESKSALENQNFEAALKAAEESIKNQPNDPAGYYFKGVALGELAETKAPSERKDVYKEMNETFEKARQIASKTENSPSELERIDPVKNALWRKEHNKAIEYAANDSVKKATKNPLKLAISHLENATVIIPDSVLSWDVLAQVHYMDNNLEGAIDAMKVVVEKKDSLIADDYLRLSGYYRLNKQPEQAIAVLEKARKAFPENVQIVQNLADAYTNADRIDESIAVIEELIAKDPENPQYHLVLGTQIYQTVLQLNEELKNNYDKMFELGRQANNASGDEAQQIEQQISDLEQRNEQIQARINRLTERATKEIKSVIKHRPNDDVAYNTLGVIYQNKAAALFEERNRETNDQKAMELDKQAKEVLRQAMEYYEKAAEIKPKNQDYWRSLFSIYTTLGMDKKAEEAMKKAGM